MANHRILIVEDSPTMRQLLVFALKRLKGVEIVEAKILGPRKARVTLRILDSAPIGPRVVTVHTPSGQVGASLPGVFSVLSSLPDGGFGDNGVPLDSWLIRDMGFGAAPIKAPAEPEYSFE